MDTGETQWCGKMALKAGVEGNMEGARKGRHGELPEEDREVWFK